MIKVLLLLPFLLLSLSAETRAQLISNKYYEVLDSCINISRTIFPLEDGRVLGYPKKKKRGEVYLLDKNQDKTELPCNQIEWNRPSEYTCFECINDSTSAFFSLRSGQTISPFYDSLHILGPNFYMAWQKDSLYLFNSKNELLFQTATELSEEKSKHLFRHCNNEQIVCRLDGEEFYLNAKGEISKDDICDNELGHSHFSDGTYLFKENKKWGLKNKEGKVLIEAKYKRINLWQTDQYIVAVQKGDAGKYLYGVVDQNENILLPVEYESIIDYEFGLSVKKERCKRVFLDINLKNKYDQEFDELRVARCGLIRGKIEGQNFYDLTFTEKIEGTEGKITSAKAITDERCQVLYEDGLYVIYDRSGKIVYSQKGEANASKIYENVLQITLSPKQSGLIDANGQWIVEPGNFRFKSTRLMEGIYRTDQDSRQSDLLNAKGGLIYSNVKNGGMIPTKNNYIVRNNQGTALVSPKGELLIPFGKYRIHEFNSSHRMYYRLTLGNVDYVVQLRSAE